MADLIIQRDGTVAKRFFFYFDIELKRRAQRNGINMTRFVNDVFRTYFEIYGDVSPTEEAAYEVARQVHALRLQNDLSEDEQIARLLAEREAREQEREQRRRDEVVNRLEAIIRQAEMELATLRGVPA